MVTVAGGAPLEAGGNKLRRRSLSGLRGELESGAHAAVGAGPGAALTTVSAEPPATVSPIDLTGRHDTPQAGQGHL